MAKYGLYLRDQTYITILQEAARNGKSMGKFLNEILDDAAIQIEQKTFGLTAKRKCKKCERLADYEFYNKDGSISYLCKLHITEKVKVESNGYKEIGER